MATKYDPSLFQLSVHQGDDYGMTSESRQETVSLDTQDLHGRLGNASTDELAAEDQKKHESLGKRLSQLSKIQEVSAHAAVRSIHDLVSAADETALSLTASCIGQRSLVLLPHTIAKDAATEFQRLSPDLHTVESQRVLERFRIRTLYEHARELENCLYPLIIAVDDIGDAIPVHQAWIPDALGLQERIDQYMELGQDYVIGQGRKLAEVTESASTLEQQTRERVKLCMDRCRSVASSLEAASGQVQRQHAEWAGWNLQQQLDDIRDSLAQAQDPSSLDDLTQERYLARCKVIQSKYLYAPHRAAVKCLRELVVELERVWKSKPFLSSMVS